MFQKLYKHLEDINTSLRQIEKHEESSDLPNQILGQLAQLNDILGRHQERALAIQRRFSALASVIIGLLVLGIAVLGWTEISQQRRSSSAVKSMAIQKSDSLQEIFASRQQATHQAHLDKLDALVIEQSESIKALKQLNTTATVALKRIRRHLTIIEQRAEPPSVLTTKPDNR